jgi:predicted metal-dependent peptidase
VAGETDKLAAAKLWLISDGGRGGAGDGPRDLPYLAHALFALRLVPSEDVPVMAADERWRLYCNPSWLAGTDVPEVGRELAHVVWHLLLAHADRARGMGVAAGTSQAWHQACDLVIRDTLDDVSACPAVVAEEARRLRLAVPGVRSAGRAAEEYYAVLSGLPVPSGGGDPAGEGDGDLGPCGSAVDGIPRGYELPPDSAVGEIDEVEGDMIRRQVAVDYLASTKGRGDRPGEALRWAKKMTDPELPWEQLLASAVRKAAGWASGRYVPTFTRPSRRASSVPDAVLPGWRRPLPGVAIVVDTSGSIDDALLGKAMSEVQGALRGLGVPDASVTVYACDTAVGAVTRVRRASDASLVGGGGTDMRVGLAVASAARPRPDMIVVFTDGYTPWPDQPPPGSVVIAAMLRREAEEIPAPPPWTTRVDCVLR